MSYCTSFWSLYTFCFQFSASVVKSYSGEGGIPLTFSIMRNGVQEIAGIYADNLGNNDQGAATTLIHLDAGEKLIDARKIAEVSVRARYEPCREKNDVLHMRS